MSDAELCDALRAGNPAALEAIHQRYGDELLRFVASRVNFEDAKDIVQDVFLYIFRRKSSIRDLRGYLYKIAQRKIVYWQSEIQHRRRDWLGGPRLTEGSGHEELRRDLQEFVAVSKLSESEHSVLHALYFDGLSVEETGQKFGLTPEAVYKRSSRAVKKLRELAATI